MPRFWRLQKVDRYYSLIMMTFLCSAQANAYRMLTGPQFQAIESHSMRFFKFFEKEVVDLHRGVRGTHRTMGKRKRREIR
jgi:hypothetical protein